MSDSNGDIRVEELEYLRVSEYVELIFLRSKYES